MRKENFQIRTTSSNLPQKEKRKLLHQVFDIIFSARKKENKKIT